MSSRTLEAYSEVEQVRSATSDRIYTVSRGQDGKLSCQCAFVQHHPGRECRHILEVRLQQAQLDLGLTASQTEQVQAAIGEFEEIMGRVEMFRSGEAQWLSSLAVAIADKNESGEVTADDVYAAVGGASGFDGDPRIIGMVFTRLLKGGMFRFSRYVKSRRNHGRPIVAMRLTEDGIRRLRA